MKDFDINRLKETPRTIETEQHKDTDQVVSLTAQMQSLQQQIQDMQKGTTKRYSLQDICPYPFHPSVDMIPFPRNCEFPKYDKYNGKTDLIDHVREFRTMSL